MDQCEWLLPQPDVAIPSSGLLAPDGSLDKEALAAFVGFAAEELAVSLPAFSDNGTPLLPPERHVLDYLARAYDLVDEDTQIDYPFAAGTARVVTGDLPECSFCEEPARYDHIVTTTSGEAGAFLCVAHARPLVTHLGAPDGTVCLLHARDVPAQIQHRVDVRLVELGRDRMFAKGESSAENA